MTVLITLTTAGADTGPFNLYTNLDGYVTPFESGVAKALLEIGYVSALVPDGTTTIRVKSAGVCTNYIDLPVGEITTTTSTTSTAAPLISLVVFARDTGPALNVTLYASINGGPPIPLANIDSVPCSELTTISGLITGDIVTFSTSIDCIMKGAVGTSCPGGDLGSSITYNYIVGAGPTESVAITINSGIIP